MSQLLLYVLILLYNYYQFRIMESPCFIFHVRVCLLVDLNLCLLVSESLRPHGLQLLRLLCPRNFLGNNTGVVFHALHGIFPTQGQNPGLPHCRQILYHLNHQGSPHSPHHYFNFLLSCVSVFCTFFFSL